MQKVVGIDIGGVLAAHRSMVEAGHDVPEIPFAFESVAYIAGHQSVKQLYVISMCDQATEQASRAWLERRNFYERTGLSQSQVIYCRAHETKAILAEEFALTDHVDDRLEVFSHFPDKIDKYLFRPRPKEVLRFSKHLPRVRIAKTWTQLATQITEG